MKLYIANPTKQTQVVCYRLDYGNDGALKDTNRQFQPARQQEIPPGRQVQLGSDLHIKQIEDIVDQLKVYGLVGVVDVPRLRAADFDNLRAGIVPYVFNIDAPIRLQTGDQGWSSSLTLALPRLRHRIFAGCSLTNLSYCSCSLASVAPASTARLI